MADNGLSLPMFWPGDLGQKLQAEPVTVRLVASYLVQSPSASWVGLFYLPLSFMTRDLGITEDEARGSLARLAAIGFAYYQEATGFVWVPDLALYIAGDRPDPKDKRAVKVRQESPSFSGSRP